MDNILFQKIKEESNEDKVESDDIKALSSEGIQIWGVAQESLENQALEELEKLVEDNQSNEEALDQPTVPNLSFEHTASKNVVSKKSFSKLSSDDMSEEDSDYILGEQESDEDYQPIRIIAKLPKKKQKKDLPERAKKGKATSTDDALDINYKARLDSYYRKLETEMQILGVQGGDDHKKDYKKIKGGLKVPNDIWEKLYEYQKEAVFWLWELHQRSTGGLLGDEMGLGKTVETIVFLHALQYTRHISKYGKFTGLGPSIIVCPATVIHQWVKHFHHWAPEFRVVILHQSSTFQGYKPNLIAKAHKEKCVLVTTYAAILKYKGHLCEYHWHYLILDEGHKIRNPSAKVTVAVKEIRTPHRIMLTGSPMQNNLTELWSLFDFTNPGMLGNLQIFTEHFANPILHGGFANATPMQEATAFSVASTLKNVISPFLLRRMKNDVKNHIQLPHKSEQVLFCSLTDLQRDLYKDYLMSEQVNNILGRGVKQWRSDNFFRAKMLMAVTALRKICNHPDLFIHEEDAPEDNNYGYYKDSGKMVVVSALLKIWKKQGHRTLLFSQGRAMLKIFEQFLQNQAYKYLRMDGTTNISSRHSMIEKFNQDPSYDVFLLTTRVGGLGINLTGANRVIIYDPDWNPATDIQARERAWRIGQEKSVTVYRLVCAGTVEEKMYQRQVWKQLLSNKVLVDPTTNKFFKSSDLFDLFSLPESPQARAETANIFRESRVRIQEKIKEKKKVQFSEDKIQKMKELAQKIAKSLTKEEPVVKKNSYEQELEEDRQNRLEEKQKLKQLTAPEIVEYNRKKTLQTESDEINKIDDKVTEVSFDEALEHSSKTAKLYHKMVQGKIKYKDIKEMKNSSSNKRKRKEPTVDTSGKIDGEQVEGLVKRESKKYSSKKQKLSNKSRDNNCILEHLFTKKGVSEVLEHDSVLNGGKKRPSLKVMTHADEKALQALDALKKSRVDKWKW